MIFDDWVTGWILDGLAKRFGPARVSGWIVLAILLAAAVVGVLLVLSWLAR